MNMIDKVAGAIAGEIDEARFYNSPAFQRAARAAIAAMREPTAEMDAAGADVPIGHSWGAGGEYVSEGSPTEIWQAMIDSVVPRAHPDQTSPMTVGPEEFLR